MSTLKTYNRIFCETFNVEEADLDENFTNQNVESWDSIGHMNLISEIEEEFDIMMDGDDIMEFQSYTAGIKILEKYEIKMGE